MGEVLWIVNHYAGLPREAAGTRHYWLSHGLQELGWDVRLIRCGPTTTRRPWQPDVEIVDGVEVTTLPGPDPHVRGAIRVRGWAEFACWLRDPRTTSHLPRPDIVLGSTVHLGAAWAARGLARRHKATFVFEVRDLWPETLIALGSLRRTSAAARGMLWLERSLAQSAALIISPMSGVGRYMEERHGVSPERFKWVSNGVNIENYSDVPAPARGGLKLQYFGAIGTANDVALIVDAVSRANQLLDAPVELQVRGAGPERNTLAERVARNPLLASAVTFPPPVPSDQVPAAMAWGNALVLTVRDLPGLYDYGISMNKLFDYLASGRWIVMGSSVADNPIADAPGLSVAHPSVESMSSQIIALSRMPAVARDRLAATNSALAEEQFSFHVLAGELSVALKLAMANPTCKRP